MAQTLLFGLSVFEVVSFTLKVMATAGGAILGWFVTPPVVRLLVRLAIHKSAPKPLVTVGRLMGALLVAAVVWSIWSFGSGQGWGFGSGWGGSPGSGQGKGGTGKQEVAKNDVQKDDTAREKDKKKAVLPVADKLTVRMRGGTGVEIEERFYLVDNKPRTLNEVKQILKDGRDHWKTVEIVIDDDSVSGKALHPMVLALQNAVRAEGLVVKTSSVEQGKTP
jgi:hypothetical protein